MISLCSRNAARPLNAVAHASLRAAHRPLCDRPPFFVARSSLSSIEHVVLWMQENRPFDFYYGTMKGVRGFSDRTAVKLPSGRPMFYQPINKNLSQYMLPWHADPSTTSSICMSAPVSLARTPPKTSACPKLSSQTRTLTP